jgi:hypothetical protein
MTQTEIQDAINNTGTATVKGMFEIKPPGLQLTDNTTLIIEGVLVAAPVDWKGKGVVSLTGKSNVKITGNIRCYGAINADGIYIRDSKSVSVDAHIEGASRNGISITGGEGIRVTATIKDTSGKVPGSGVDVEPNPGSTVNGVSFVDCEIVGNHNGVTIDAAHGAVTGISLSHCSIHDNRGHGISGSGLLGSVEIDHCKFVANGLRQVFIEPADIVTVDHTEASGSPAGYESVYIKANVLSSITGSQIHDNGNDGLHVAGAGKHTITGNFFWRNATANFNRPEGAIIANNQELPTE